MSLEGHNGRSMPLQGTPWWKRLLASEALPFILCGTFGFYLGHPNPLVHVPLAILLVPFSLFMLAAKAPTGKKAFLHGWWLGLGGQALALYWLGNPMHDVAGIPYFLAAPCIVLLAAYLSCYTGLACLGMQRVQALFARTAPEKRTLFGQVLAPVLCGLAYGGFEVICGVLLTGFPWLTLGTAFAPWPAWIQAASLVGSYALSALYAVAACFAAASVVLPREKRLFSGTLAVIVFVTVPVFGYVRLQNPEVPRDAETFSVVMVQGNIDQNQKWVPAFQQNTVNHYISLSQNILDELQNKEPKQFPDLVIWPETAMPFYFQHHREYSGQLRRFVTENNVSLAFGTLGLVDNGTQNPLLRNRMYILSPEGIVAGYYDKQHLVPFGEYTPFALELPFLQDILMGMDFSSGEDAPALLLPRPVKKRGILEDAPPLPHVGGHPQTGQSSVNIPPKLLPLGVLICYEAIFPEMAQKRVREGARVFIIISNDAWFGMTSAPQQHLNLTAMRAVEQAKPVVRATNTGYTATIDARGRVVQRSGLFEDATYFATVVPSGEITLYHRLHPLPEWLLVIAALLSLVGYTFRKFAE